LVLLDPRLTSRAGSQKYEKKKDIKYIFNELVKGVITNEVRNPLANNPSFFVLPETSKKNLKKTRNILNAPGFCY
jgi:hypothetical protein